MTAGWISLFSFVFLFGVVMLGFLRWLRSLDAFALG